MGFEGVTMATSKKAAKSDAAQSSASASDIQAVLKRVKSSELANGDKSLVVGLLDRHLRLTKLLERAKDAGGGKKILATLPGGFDIVK